MRDCGISVLVFSYKGIGFIGVVVVWLACSLNSVCLNVALQWIGGCVEGALLCMTKPNPPYFIMYFAVPNM